MTPDILARDIAIDMMSNRFVDLARAFAQADRTMALAFLDETEKRIAADLSALGRKFGGGKSSAEVLAPAARLLRDVIMASKEAAQTPLQ